MEHAWVPESCLPVVSPCWPRSSAKLDLDRVPASSRPMGLYPAAKSDRIHVLLLRLPVLELGCPKRRCIRKAAPKLVVLPLCVASSPALLLSWWVPRHWKFGCHVFSALGSCLAKCIVRKCARSGVSATTYTSPRRARASPGPPIPPSSRICLCIFRSVVRVA